MNSRLRASRLTFNDRDTNLARPSNVRLDTAVGVLDETKESFKGLENDPQSTGKEGNRPGNEEKEDQPEKGKARISSHDDGSVKMDC